MKDTWSGEGVWFVYDGECPMCSMAAHALRIRKHFGTLHLVDARQSADHPLLREIARRRLDLDEGMVIWCGGRYYHGRDALAFMAQFADEQGTFNRVNRLLFRSETLTHYGYPTLRAIRNLLLLIKGVRKIENLAKDRLSVP